MLFTWFRGWLILKCYYAKLGKLYLVKFKKGVSFMHCNMYAVRVHKEVGLTITPKISIAYSSFFYVHNAGKHVEMQHWTKSENTESSLA